MAVGSGGLVAVAGTGVYVGGGEGEVGGRIVGASARGKGEDVDEGEGRGEEVAEGGADVRLGAGGDASKTSAMSVASGVAVEAVVGRLVVRWQASINIPSAPKPRPMNVRRETYRRTSNIGPASCLSSISPVMLRLQACALTFA